MNTHIEVMSASPRPSSTGKLYYTCESIRYARNDGAILLPVEDRLINDPPNGASAFVLKQYGDGFEPLNTRRFCPTAIWVDPCVAWLNYAIELRAIGVRQQGRIRVGPDISQRGTITPSAFPHHGDMTIETLFANEFRLPTDTVFTTGSLPVGVAIEGLLGLALWGELKGSVIMQFAITVSNKE